MDSAKIRRQIGVARRNLSRNIANVKVIFEDYGLQQDSLQLEKLDDNEVQDFRAEISNKVCTCTTGHQKATCSCSDGTVKNYLEPNPLPQIAKNFMIYEHENKILAKTQVGSAIQLHMVAEDLKIKSRQHNSSCEIETTELTGCYSCTTGAEATVVCTSTDEETTASLDCNQQTQIVRCTKVGHVNKVTFNFDKSHIEMTCKAACPGGTTNVNITGKLNFVSDGLFGLDNRNEELIIETTRDVSAIRTAAAKAFGIVKTIVSSIKNFFGMSIMFIVAFIGILVIIVTPRSHILISEGVHERKLL
ncbi:hypothetical protein ANCCAN_12297 [Ancylostoma caninum]|uniref:Phlebovirus glycoprotein G2 fusion domain-containing protein n=1 Tax=Ancylostoma caninum TaxID=29170 RepID=A0A368GBH7_ANCCA|nr:hypothetical protein ANCCAN_12297 [Ancylostoma caninum]